MITYNKTNQEEQNNEKLHFEFLNLKFKNKYNISPEIHQAWSYTIGVTVPDGFLTKYCISFEISSLVVLFLNFRF